MLTSLQTNTRQNLQTLLQQFGTALKKGGPSYNASIKYWLPAYEYSAVVAHDALGIEPHDLSNAINDQGTVSGAIDTHPQNLENLITNFNTTADAFARENVSLENAVAALPKTLSGRDPGVQRAQRRVLLGTAGARLRARAAAAAGQGADPRASQSTGPMIDASLPFITQLRYLVSPSELRGLTADLSKTVPGAVEPDAREHPADGQRRAARRRAASPTS